MRRTLVQIVAVICLVPAAGFAQRALSGGTIITEPEVQEEDGFPFSNTAFDPYVLAVGGTTMYFASVNVTGTYLDTQVFSFDIDADENGTTATEFFNDSLLKGMFNAQNSFWYYSTGDVAGTDLFLIAAEDSDGDDGEYIEFPDVERLLRVDTSGIVVYNVATNADGCVGLTEVGGIVYLLTDSARGGPENGIYSVSAAAINGTISVLVTEATIIGVTGGTAPMLTSIDSTPEGDLLFADNETHQILKLTDPAGTVTLSVLVDAATLQGTALGDVTVTGLGVFSPGGFIVSDTLEVAGGDRGIIGFNAAGTVLGVMADEAQIVTYALGDDHNAFTPNNEIQISGDDRAVICNTDNPETIYWLEDPDYYPAELTTFTVE